MKKLSLFLIPILFIGCMTFAFSKEYKLVGSRRSTIYHYETCRYAQIIRPYLRIYFNSPEEAIRVGYRPCKICRPPVKTKEK